MEIQILSDAYKCRNQGRNVVSLLNRSDKDRAYEAGQGSELQRKRG